MILFLDFDGVTHPVGSNSDSGFSQLPLLEQFLRDDAPAWQVVISSSWREYYTWPQLLEVFSPDIRARVIGCTPPDDSPCLVRTWGAMANLYPREFQIRQYLAQHCLAQSDWCALDDMAGWFVPLSTNLILCNPCTGVTAQELTVLRSRLLAAPQTRQPLSGIVDEPSCTGVKKPLAP
ncbi:MAG: hypothetical protein IPG23_16955 [Burkholderiales bacterium]|nr:hypothetical protein [Burkholderiales bacterium]